MPKICECSLWQCTCQTLGIVWSCEGHPQGSRWGYSTQWVSIFLCASWRPVPINSVFRTVFTRFLSRSLFIWYNLIGDVCSEYTRTVWISLVIVALQAYWFAWVVWFGARCDILIVVLNHEPALLRTFLVHQPSNTLFSELVGHFSYLSVHALSNLWFSLTVSPSKRFVVASLGFRYLCRSTKNIFKYEGLTIFNNWRLRIWTLVHWWSG